MKVSNESNIAYAIMFTITLVMALIGKASYWGLVLIIGCYIGMRIILCFMEQKAKKKIANKVKKELQKHDIKSRYRLTPPKLKS